MSDNHCLQCQVNQLYSKSDSGRQHEQKQQRVMTILEEIVRYLETHENVADTVEGIFKWWILRQRLQEAEEDVKAALELLCSRGVIAKKALSDGRVLYASAKKNKH